MPKKGDRLSCSFCTKSQDEVKKLIAGAKAFICDECVDLCNEILDEELFEDSGHSSLGGSSSSSPENMVGEIIAGDLEHLSTSNLIRSLVLSRLSCTMVAESGDSVLVATLEQGKPMKARLNDLKGDEALIEFLASWTMGRFRCSSEYDEETLEEDCGVNSSLEKLLEAAEERKKS